MRFDGFCVFAMRRAPWLSLQRLANFSKNCTEIEDVFAGCGCCVKFCLSGGEGACCLVKSGFPLFVHVRCDLLVWSSQICGGTIHGTVYRLICKVGPLAVVLW